MVKRKIRFQGPLQMYLGIKDHQKLMIHSVNEVRIRIEAGISFPTLFSTYMYEEWRVNDKS